MNATADKSQISKFVIKKGDIMITKDSETPDDIGISAVSLEDFEDLVCGYHLALFRPYKDKICGEFLAKQLGQYKVNRQFANKANGSTRYGLTLNVIKTAVIPFPVSVEKQCKIAHILTTCDTVIEKTQSAIAKYKAIKQGLLHNLFTRGLEANGHLRPSFHNAPELYKESELGMIPKEWEVKRFEEIAFVNPPTNIPSTFNLKTQVTFLKMEDVSNGGSIINNRSFPIENLQKKGFTLFQENDVLFAKITPCMENGKGALAPNLFNGIGYGSTEFHVFRPRNLKSISYIYFLSVSSKFRLLAESQMTGSAGQQRVSTKYLENYKIATPQLDEQFQIGVRLNTIDNKIKSEETLLQKYQSIKRGLMGDLLGGKKEV
jgi:type I restriction enzyme S subunit